MPLFYPGRFIPFAHIVSWAFSPICPYRILYVMGRACNRRTHSFSAHDMASMALVMTRLATGTPTDVVPDLFSYSRYQVDFPSSDDLGGRIEQLSCWGTLVWPARPMILCKMCAAF